jgi:nitrite reductase/ring-hydroxylating ferredoxin subunit
MSEMHITPEENAGAPDDCGGCPLHDAFSAPAAMERRSFFRAAGLALASLGVLGLDARAASAMPVRALTALASGGTGQRNDKRYPLPAEDGVSIDKDNSVIIARASGKIYAFSLGCPHQNTALRWDADDHQFMCPKHKSHYRDDGTFINGRATRDMDRLPIRREGAELVVDVDTVYQQDDNPREWGAAFIPA